MKIERYEKHDENITAMQISGVPHPDCLVNINWISLIYSPKKRNKTKIDPFKLLLDIYTKNSSKQTLVTIQDQSKDSKLELIVYSNVKISEKQSIDQYISKNTWVSMSIELSE